MTAVPAKVSYDTAITVQKRCGEHPMNMGCEARVDLRQLAYFCATSSSMVDDLGGVRGPRHI